MDAGILPLVVVLLVIAGSYAVKGLIERKREASYQQYCETRGFHYEAKRPGAAEQYATVAKIFTRGSKHRWRNEISGQFAGSPFPAFEYLYSVSQGRGSTTIKLAMIHWQIPGQSFPSFALAPETPVSQVKEFFGAQDIDFADDPVFSRFYVLNGTDEAAVRRLFTPSVRHALVLERWHRVAGAGTDLFWWQERGLPPPEAIDAFLSEGDSVRKIFAGVT